MMATTTLSKSQAVAASIAFSLAGCLVYMAMLRDDSGTNREVSAGPLEVYSHRLLYDILNDQEEVPDLFPLEVLDYVGFFCAIGGLILAAGAGIGGGGILVPIFILIFGFCIKHSIPLASVTVLGGAIANNILNASKAHPDHPSRPVIDWDLIIQLEPMTIAGALIGADLNDFLPYEVLVILLFLLLSLTAYKIIQKANKLHQKETEEFLKQEQETVRLMANGGRPDVEKTQNNGYGSVTNGNTPSAMNGNMPSTKGEPFFGAQPSFGEDQVHQAWIAAAQLTILFLVVTFLNLLKGGPEAGGGPLGLDFCGPGCFWISQFGIFGIIFAFAAWMRHSILGRLQSGGPVLSEIDWDEDNTIRYPAYAIVAGLVAGMFGVGGGIIKGPLMLALGVHPAVASATSACMILFTSSTATISYMIFGLLIYDYAIGCLVMGFLATIVGQTLMALLMKKYNRNSYIAYTIGLVVGLSAIAMTVESVLAIIGM